MLVIYYFYDIVCVNAYYVIIICTMHVWVTTYLISFSCQQQKLLVDPVSWGEWHYLLEPVGPVIVASHYLGVSGLISAHKTIIRGQ